MLLVTGGAGFIGSNVVADPNEAGRTAIAVNDILGTGQKWRNLAARRVAEFVPAGELLRWLDGRKLDAVVHMGAVSSTTESNVDLLMENNFRLSLRLFEWCAATIGTLDTESLRS
jgi:ADP-L-glycero-D-manno-heptose 6-epimerase